MKITVKKLADLRKPAHNIRRHSDKQITEYIRSIEMFGQIKPLVVDEHGEIIAGNGLFEALTRMGRETCDCYVVTGLTDVQKKKLMMADNKVYELGFTDTDSHQGVGFQHIQRNCRHCCVLLYIGDAALKTMPASRRASLSASFMV